MKKKILVTIGVLALGVVTFGCADGDNPTALSELNPDTEFDVEATRVETFEEVEVHVRISDRGSPLEMSHAELEIEHHTSGATRSYEMEPEGDGYAAHVMFFQPGEHHIHLQGTPEGHQLHLMAELGEHEVEVHRRHQVIGPYWVELEMSPAPVFETEAAHIHLHVFELLEDGTIGDEVGGLQIECEIHDPHGVESALVVDEEAAGEYEVAYGFGEAGIYELHVDIEVNGLHEEGAFHIPVLSPDVGDAEDHEDEGDGNGHTH